MTTKKLPSINADSNPRAGVPHQYSLISESGLYALVFRSRKPEAKTFSKWIRAEVLPALRKTGTYNVPSLSPKSESGSLHEEATTGTMRLQDTFPYKSRTYFERAVSLAEEVGVSDADVVYEMYLCYCKLFHTQEPLVDDISNAILPAHILKAIWNEVCRTDNHVYTLQKCLI